MNLHNEIIAFLYFSQKSYQHSLKTLYLSRFKKKRHGDAWRLQM